MIAQYVCHSVQEGEKKKEGEAAQRGRRKGERDQAFSDQLLVPFIPLRGLAGSRRRNKEEWKKTSAHPEGRGKRKKKDSLHSFVPCTVHFSSLICKRAMEEGQKTGKEVEREQKGGKKKEEGKPAAEQVATRRSSSFHHQGDRKEKRDKVGWG